jgi:hypothetical protein
MSQQQQVNPADGNAVPPAPGPANIPPAKRAFRRTDGNVSLGPVAPPQSYTKELGIPPIVGALQGYKESDFYDFQFSTSLPSGLNMQAIWYLTCNRLSSHDRFLKDTTSWHPHMDNLYLATTVWYHVLRCRRDLGQLNTEEHGLLATLEQRYPPSNVHIPGVYVPILMSITTTNSPYPWQSAIGPGITANITNATQGSQYLPRNNVANFVPIPAVCLDLVYTLLSHRRATADESVLVPFTDGTNPHFLGQNWNNGHGHRHVVNTIYCRTGNPASPRAEDAFWYNNATPNTRAAGAPAPSAAWDLPARPITGNNLTALTMPQFMCLVDLPGSGNNTRYRNWYSAYSSVMNLQCQYISGSRTLNDIATVGIGAMSTVWTYTANTLTMTNPTVAGNNGNWTLAELTALVAARYYTQLEAAGVIRDPELNQSALQLAAIAMVNVDLSQQAGNAPAGNQVRVGPFWNMSQCASSPVVDIVPILAANVANCISSIVRK